MTRTRTAPLRCAGPFGGGQGRGRTADTTIFSRVLYQLSYLTGMVVHRGVRWDPEMHDSRSTVVRFDRPL